MLATKGIVYALRTVVPLTFTASRSIAPDAAIAVVNGHLVASLRTRPTPELVGNLEAFAREHVRANQRFGYYLRIGDGASPPDDALRARLRALGAKLLPNIAAISVLVAIPGFSGAAIRGVITGMSLFFGGAIKIRPSANERDAAANVASELRANGLPPLTEDELREAFDALSKLREA